MVLKNINVYQVIANIKKRIRYDRVFRHLSKLG